MPSRPEEPSPRPSPAGRGGGFKAGAAMLSAGTNSKPGTPKRWKTILRALGSLLPRRGSAGAAGSRSGGGSRPHSQPPPSQIVRPWREDAFRAYPTVGLTPSKALAFLQSADGGHPAVMFELFREMLQKWPRLG